MVTRWSSRIWWNMKQWLISNNHPITFSPEKKRTSIFGKWGVGTDKLEWRDGGVNGEEWCTRGEVFDWGNGSNGGWGDGYGDEALSSYYNFTIISVMTFYWAARELGRMWKDLGWLFRMSSKDSEWFWTVEQRKSILAKMELWRVSWSSIEDNCLSNVCTQVTMPSIMKAM